MSYPHVRLSINKLKNAVHVYQASRTSMALVQFLHDRRGVPTCVQGHPEDQSVVQAEGRAIQLNDFFTNSITADVVLSLASTLGLYIFAFLIFVSRLFIFSVFSFY